MTSSRISTPFQDSYKIVPADGDRSHRMKQRCQDCDHSSSCSISRKFEVARVRLDALQSGLSALMLLSVGFSTALFLGKERSPARTILLGASVMVGVAAATTPPLLDSVNRSHPGLASRLQGLPESG